MDGRARGMIGVRRAHPQKKSDAPWPQDSCWSRRRTPARVVIADAASLILPYLWPEPPTHRPGPCRKSLLLYLRRTLCRKRPSLASLAYIISAFLLTTTTTHQPSAFSRPPFNHRIPPTRTSSADQFDLTDSSPPPFQRSFVTRPCSPSPVGRAKVPFGVLECHCPFPGTLC